MLWRGVERHAFTTCEFDPTTSLVSGEALAARVRVVPK